MKGSIRLKITLWFSAALIAVVALAYFVILSASNQVIQKTIRDALIETVESNVDEVEFYSSMEEVDPYNDVDHFVQYGEGYLEIDDDFLDSVNAVHTGLYSSERSLLYGENPIARETAETAFLDARVQKVGAQGMTYYVFDRKLEEEGLEGLWLRGVVSERQGEVQMHDIYAISLIVFPSLVILAIIGGYLIAGRMLRPIQKISVTAAQIGQGGDLKKRIEIGQGKDELHQLAGSFNQMFERLERAFEAERQFTSDASHELRTPMAVIMAQCEYSLQNPGTEEDYQKALQVIHRQGEKMSRLIGDMLDFMRLELRADAYPKSRLDFSALTEEICSDMALIREKGITLQKEIQKGIFVMGNEELLTRLLINLIGNAYRYGRENGHIHVVLERGKEGAVLRVQDDGIGIAKQDQQKIFRRFYQAEPSHAGMGSGLGLCMVWEIARLHGGQIHVESELGVGSVFEFSMPEEG